MCSSATLHTKLSPIPKCCSLTVLALSAIKKLELVKCLKFRAIIPYPIFNSFLLLYPNLILGFCLSAYSKAFVKIFLYCTIRRDGFIKIAFTVPFKYAQRKLHLIFIKRDFFLYSLIKSEENTPSSLSHHHSKFLE